MSKQTYESALEELKEIIEKIQNDDINIDDLATNISKASKLVKFCQDKLRNVEKDVSKLIED